MICCTHIMKMYPARPAPARIEEFLRNTIGLDIESIGGSSIDRALHERMDQCGLRAEADYYELLKLSGRERDALLERIVVPETWFFRDRKPFQMLQKYVVEEWLPSRSEQIRLLSIPCSTGEEPYSLAMALLDIGLSTRRIRIDACDISHLALCKAQRAVYCKNSFRSGDLSFRERYFDATAGGYALKEIVRVAVSFSCENLLDPGFAQDKGLYDVIFFRNLMIYLSREHQERALALMDRLLAPSGLLFVGHAETGPLAERWFTSVRYPFAFAHRKHSDERRKPLASPVPKVPVLLRSRTAGGRKPRASTKPAPGARSEIQSPCPARPNYLVEARNLADQGKLEEARRLCETAVRVQAAGAETYYLLGLINGARELESQAEECFHKAVYLEPHHYQALSQLALAAERRGDFQAAEIFRQRARRSEQRRDRMEA